MDQHQATLQSVATTIYSEQYSKIHLKGPIGNTIS